MKPGFQLRTENGSSNVYMVRFQGVDIPRDLQRVVFAHKTRDRSQVVCDALNNGMLARITLAANALRAGR